MSDDIPIIFSHDVCAGSVAPAPVVVFVSAASAPQMQQYAAAGWRVIVPPDFKSKSGFNLAEVPAATVKEEDIAACTAVSCEALFLRSDLSARIERWRPAYVKINCAFHGVADAGSLAPALAAAGYTIFGAHWRDDNSFSIRSVAAISPLSAFASPEWDRLNLIAVLDPQHARTFAAIGRLYAGEERRITELRVANAIRNDHIAKLEDALAAQQPSELFKLQRS